MWVWQFAKLQFLWRRYDNRRWHSSQQGRKSFRCRLFQKAATLKKVFAAAFYEKAATFLFLSEKISKWLTRRTKHGKIRLRHNWILPIVGEVFLFYGKNAFSNFPFSYDWWKLCRSNGACVFRAWLHCHALFCCKPRGRQINFRGQAHSGLTASAVRVLHDKRIAVLPNGNSKSVFLFVPQARKGQGLCRFFEKKRRKKLSGIAETSRHNYNLELIYF